MHRRPDHLKALKLAMKIGLACGCICAGTRAFAKDFRIGAAIGLGGAGITTSTELNGQSTAVQRAEAPGMMELFADVLVRDDMSLGLEHIRGFRFGPLSSGTSFTGANLRWYFMGPAPAVDVPNEGQSVLLVKRYTPFVGLATGLAFADISRQGDLVANAKGSGLYLGLRIGADYPLAPGLGLRPEITTSTTIMSQGPTPSTVSEFSLQCGIYFLY